jgi:hypothetical protein
MNGKTEIGTRHQIALVVATALLVISCFSSSGAYAENKARFTATSSASSASSNASTASRDTSTKSIAHVYQCTLDGQRAFSDQPCGTDSKARDIDAPNRMDASDLGDAAHTERASAARVTRRVNRNGAFDANADKKSRCAKIGTDKEHIMARMRTGYSGKEGERLRDRLRKLDSDDFELRCSRYR